MGAGADDIAGIMPLADPFEKEEAIATSPHSLGVVLRTAAGDRQHFRRTRRLALKGGPCGTPEAAAELAVKPSITRPNSPHPFGILG